MFSKILIANRGEIACRVMRTAQAMGVACVAIYSDADAKAVHVEMADEAYNIGPPPVAQSYLKINTIIDIARQSGAQAIHPGYGFLSENPDFVEAVAAAGLAFIGPSAEAIRAMGLKDAAKKLMEEAGVPVVPGYHEDNQDPTFLAEQAEEIGYPVLIKARAGGGGKGMRKVDHAKDFASALEGAQRESKASFGDDHVLIEKYISSPRHIEVQVFGDNYGDVVHLFERDCSLQRRHQKVIEEAPAPGMTDEMREAMTSAAVRAAEAIRYSGAGTIEFIVDGSEGLRSDGFWFMEMNTRLQVEHPVTEAVTGVDLVEWQLKVASGESLPLKQDELTISGHAFEARLYAEDVPKGFLPATGKLEWLEFSHEGRVDTGVGAQDVISPFYDPMIAKLISEGSDRAEALRNLSSMLRETQIAGLTTNQRFLRSLCEHDGFAEGKVDTGLIDRDLESLTAIPEISDELVALTAMTAMGLPASKHLEPDYWFEDHPDPFDHIWNYGHWSPKYQYIRLLGDDCEFNVRVGRDETNSVWVAAISRNGQEYGNWIEDPRSADTSLYTGSQDFGGRIAVFGSEHTYELTIVDPLEAAQSIAPDSDAITSPMPGLVKVLNGVEGKTVKKGDVVAVLEAMKMEHSLAAPRDGTIEKLHITQGDQVEDGALLVSLASEDG